MLTTPLPRFANGANEPTASIMWRALLAYRVDPYAVVLWNAFPFHPHHPGEPPTNRAPGQDLPNCQAIRTRLLALYPGARVVAVGDPTRVALGDRVIFRHIGAKEFPAYRLHPVSR